MALAGWSAIFASDPSFGSSICGAPLLEQDASCSRCPWSESSTFSRLVIEAPSKSASQKRSLVRVGSDHNSARRCWSCPVRAPVFRRRDRSIAFGLRLRRERLERHDALALIHVHQPHALRVPPRLTNLA